jgi:hypothetical protein
MSSKFKGILDRAKDREIEPEAETVTPPSPAPLATASSKKRGRPSGKRSDDQFIQITAYIHKETHRDVKIALLKSNADQDFSELVDGLLADWLRLNT